MTRVWFQHGLCLMTAQVLLGTLLAGADDAMDSGPNVNVRSEFRNSRIRFERERTGRVAFIGGSITEMEGYRPLVMSDLRRRFPETEFEFMNAGIASTCSTTGAFRLEQDVLSAGPVDLLFVEFAVNDDQDAGHERRECIRGMEGILRRARAENPRVDLVLTHFVNPSMLQAIQDGQTPLTIAAHEHVAEEYQVSSIALAAEVARRIRDGSLTWEEYGGTHPAARGNQLCADMIARLFDHVWRDPLSATVGPESHTSPADPIDSHSYFHGRFVLRDQVHPDDFWRIQSPDWSQVPGTCRDRFQKNLLFTADEADAELRVDFTGTAIGAYLLAGPDAGILRASIDDAPEQSFNLYHRFSRNLHYPRTVMFATDLEGGPHVLKLRIASEIIAPSTGRAARIIEFVAN